MPYDTKSIITSERAYEILRFISQKEKGSYSTQIARELDMNQSLVSDIIQKLTKIGILEKGERKRAQYYIVDMGGFPTIFSEIWSRQLGISESSSIQNFIEVLISELEEKKPKDSDNSNALIYDGLIYKLRSNQSAYTSDLESFIEIYSRRYLERFDVATVEKMVYSDFKTSLYKESGDIPNFSILQILTSSLNLISDNSISLYETYSDSKKEILQNLLDISSVDISGSADEIQLECKACGDLFERKGVESGKIILACGCSNRKEEVPREIFRRIPSLKQDGDGLWLNS